MTPTKHQIFTAMCDFCGSFANALAIAWFRADEENEARIEATFPELVARYAEMAKLKMEAANEA